MAKSPSEVIYWEQRTRRHLARKTKFYDPKKRPSGHDIGKGFGKNNKGVIPSNLLQIPNSESNGAYMAGCKAIGIKSHPARFPAKLPEFFIKFLTEPEDIVVDIFGGSNTTGFVAETERRNWYSFDMELKYVAASAFRFLDKGVDTQTLSEIYEAIKNGESVDIKKYKKQLNMFREESAEYKA